MTSATDAVVSIGFQIWKPMRGQIWKPIDTRVGRPLTPMSVAGVARRHNRRAAYGYGLAGAAVVGTAGAVAATNGPYYSGWGNNNWSNAYAQADSHYGQPFYVYRAYNGVSPYYGFSGWDDYAARSAIRCTPGSLTKLDDGRSYICQ